MMAVAPSSTSMKEAAPPLDPRWNRQFVITARAGEDILSSGMSLILSSARNATPSM